MQLKFRTDSERCLKTDMERVFTNMSGKLSAFPEAVEHMTCSGMITYLYNQPTEIKGDYKKQEQTQKTESGREFDDERDAGRSKVKSR